MYTIHPIHAGTFDLQKSGMTYLVDEGFTMRTPVIVFLLRPTDPADPVIVVDAGAEDGHVAGRMITDGGPDPIREKLAEYDLTPSDVDYLVLTHLHHDHAANVDMFPAATVIVQETELAATKNPLPYMERTYIENHVMAVEDADTRIIDGTIELADGLSLTHTPGHTQGMQSVLVETREGMYAIAGDLVYCAQNLNPTLDVLYDVNGEAYEVTPVDWGYIPPGLHIDVQVCYESIERIRDRVPDAAILGGHLPETLEHAEYPPAT